MILTFSHQLRHLASARLKSCTGWLSDFFMIALLIDVALTANDTDVDIVDWSEAAKNLLSAIGDILSLTDAATLQVTRKPKRIFMQGKSSTTGERRWPTGDIEVLNPHLEAKGGHSHVAMKHYRTKPSACLQAIQPSAV